MSESRGLLGGHVGRGAHHRAGFRLAAVLVGSAREAEVGDFGNAVDGEQDIRGFQIPMHDVAAVRQVHGARDRFDQPCRFDNRQWPAFKLLGEVFPLNELQCAIGISFRLADLVDLHNVGMLQTRDSLGLDPKPRKHSWIDRGVDPHHLECHGPLEFQVARLVNDPHAASAENFQDLVAFNPREFVFPWRTIRKPSRPSFDGLDHARVVGVAFEGGFVDLLKPLGERIERLGVGELQLTLNAILQVTADRVDVGITHRAELESGQIARKWAVVTKFHLGLPSIHSLSIDLGPSKARGKPPPPSSKRHVRHGGNASSY